MTSRETCDECARKQKSIDRLALELAAVRLELEEAEGRARTWRRVAQWIHTAFIHPED